MHGPRARLFRTDSHARTLRQYASFRACARTLRGDLMSDNVIVGHNCGLMVKDKHSNLKWRLKELVIDDHVIVPCLSPFSIGNPNIINEYTSSLVTAPPMNPCRPLWEVHVLNVSSADAAASLVFRIHHSVGDCVSMLSLILSSTTKSAPPNILPTIPQRRKSASVGYLQMLYTVILGLWLTFLCVLNYGATLLWKRDRTLLTGKSTKKIGSKRLAHVTLSIEDICLVRKAVNGTLNDVIAGALSAGFVRYMSRPRYDKNISAPHEKEATSKEQHDLPLNTRLRAMVAVNMRPFTILKDLDENMQNPSKSMWGNKLGFWMFPLPMLHHGDPLQYCRDTVSMSRRKKLSFEAKMTSAVTRHMPTKLVAYLTRKLAVSTTMGFSNVMGPVEQIQYDDNPVTHIIPTAHVNYASIVIHFMSYAGKGKLVALVSEEVIPDPQQLCQDCADALQVMKEAANVQSNI